MDTPRSSQSPVPTEVEASSESLAVINSSVKQLQMEVSALNDALRLALVEDPRMQCGFKEMFDWLDRNRIAREGLSHLVMKTLAWIGAFFILAALTQGGYDRGWKACIDDRARNHILR